MRSRLPRNYLLPIVLALGLFLPMRAAAVEIVAATAADAENQTENECDSMVFVAARFLIDDAEKQKRLGVEHLEILVRCKADLYGIEMPGADLRGVVLAGGRLPDVDLEGARLSSPDKKADLRGTNLNGANLEGADLRGADLTGADLRHAFLKGALLDGTDLSDTRLTWPRSRGQVEFQGLTEAQLNSACWKTGAPPRLPSRFKDYKRPGDAPSDCPE
ncbi:MAG: pentapeptide repeat-containing protein [Deltaproteobacteria bacterium]